MEMETPKGNQKHNNASADMRCQCPYNSKKTLGEWIRDANGIIAIVTIVIAIIALCSLRESKVTSKRQLRAYIAPILQNTKIEYPSVKVSMIIENFGITPAQNCKVNRVMEILPFPLPQTTIFKISTDKIKQTSRIYPKQSTPTISTVEKTFLSADLVDTFSKKATSAVYVYGILTYDDIFNDDHSTKFCFFINPETAGWAECDQHNDFN